MEVPVDPALAANVCGQLTVLNARHRAAECLVADYVACLQRLREARDRNVELMGELERARREAAERRGQLEGLARRAFRAQQLEQVEAVLSEVTTDRDGLREKVVDLESQVGEMASANAAVKAQSDEYQARIAADASEIIDLRVAVATLTERLEHQETSTSVAVGELDAQRARVAECEMRAAALSRENGELLQRMQEKAEHEMRMHQDVVDLQREVLSRKASVERMERQASIEREYEASRSGSFNLGPLANLLSPKGRRRPACADRDRHRRRMFEAVEALEADAGSAKAVSILSDVIKALGEEDVKEREKPNEDIDFEIVRPEECLPLAEEAVVPRTAFRGVSHGGPCTSLAYSPNGMLLATGGMDKVVATWYAPTRLRQKSLRAFDSIMDVAFTSNGEHVLGGGVDKSVLVWQTLSGRQLHTLRGHTRGVNCITCAPDDPARAISSGEDRSIILWDLARGQQLTSLCPNNQVCAVCYTTSSDTILSGHMDGTIRLWDLRASKMELEQTQVHSGRIVSLQRLESHAALSAGKDNCLKYWDTAQAQVVTEFWHRDFQLATVGAMGKCRCTVCCSPDQRYVVAGTTAGSLLVWDTREACEGKRTQVLKTPHHKEPVVGCAWGRQGDMVSCDKAGVVVFWRDTPV
ncbi:unnamed protein product [Ostreobium quekettii]|uniref:Guanine nucleotide-binding protein subunit beta-like protein n=1 Tax=Ostreobium quekettii TaxID=121088 RepID=A0A8S1J8W3_9CHLO|nr:unnamed protein product [Ostreobium quekettii]